jgi:hypothetical protein
MLRRNRLLKDIIIRKARRRDRSDGKTRKKTYVALDDLKEMRWYWKLEEEALDCTAWRTCFGRGCDGPVVRQTAEWMYNPYLADPHIFSIILSSLSNSET